jgi:hypothetical protein
VTEASVVGSLSVLGSEELAVEAVPLLLGDEAELLLGPVAASDVDSSPDEPSSPHPKNSKSAHGNRTTPRD